MVDFAQFIQMFCSTDYRPEEDIAGRRIQEIVAMAKSRGLNIRGLFKAFDANKSGAIDNEQFVSLIRKIAPEISNLVIKQMWDRFDHDSSG